MWFKNNDIKGINNKQITSIVEINISLQAKKSRDLFISQRPEGVMRKILSNFKSQEENMKQIREDLKVKSHMFSSEHIKNVLLIINFEHEYSKDHFERNFKAKIFHLIILLKNKKNIY